MARAYSNISDYILSYPNTSDNYSSWDFNNFCPEYTVNVPNVVMLCLELVVGVPANVSLILLVAKVRELRTAPNLLLANLAVGDLIFLLTCLPPSITSAFGKYGSPFVFCRLNVGVYYTSFAVSSLSLTAISFERYCAIVKPLALRRVRESRSTLIICAVIWLISISLFGFYPWYLTTGSFCGVCSLDYHTNGFKTYFLLQLLCLYFGPVLCMTVFYAFCTHELVCKRKILARGTSSRGNSADRSRRRVAFNLMLITFLFAVCWFPNYAYFLCLLFFTEWSARYSRQIYVNLRLVRQVLYYLASCINPLVLYAMSSSFRLHLLNLLTCSKNGARSRRNGYNHARDNARSITLKSTIRMQEATSNTII